MNLTLAQAGGRLAAMMPAFRVVRFVLAVGLVIAMGVSPSAT